MAIYKSIHQGRYIDEQISAVSQKLPLTGGVVNGTIQAEKFVGTLEGEATRALVADSCSGTAARLETARTISLTGDVTGSGSFDGSGNLSIAATVADDSHNHTKMIQHYTRSEIGIAPNFDNITQNGIFEMRSTSETTGETGNKPFNGYAPFVNLRAEHVVLQLTGTNNAGYFIRGKQGADINLNDTTWKRLWVQGDSVTGAVWNDYAECRESDCDEPGYVLSENGDDTLSKSAERLAPFAGVSSDTWGFSQGETEKAKTHIAVAGRVLVYPYQDRNNYKPGDCVCAAPGGTVDIMTREEVINWPDRIVGTVSCVPDYEEWGAGDREAAKVNGRIWIKVK